MQKVMSLLLTLIFLVAQSVQSAPAQKYQPLSKQEKEFACQAAIAKIMPGTDAACDGNSIASSRLQRSISQSINLNALDRTELLLIERRQSDKNVQSQFAIRKADVYTYNYQTNTLTHNIINTSNNNVLRTENVQNVQLPLTSNEITKSKTIASNDPLLHQYLEKEYLLITGKKLQSFDQLGLKAFVFLAKSMPGQTNAAAQSCGLHRCARLVMHTSDRVALETAPIIDLSTGAVVQRKTGEQ